MKKLFLLVAIIAFGTSVMAQEPTLRIVTEDPALPSELYYGDIKVKPLRLRPGTNVPITIDDADFFSTQHYLDFLRRFPDTPGLVHWSGEITVCNTAGGRFPGESLEACISRKRANTSAAFFLSPEFQNTGSFVVRVYWGTLGKQHASQCGVLNNLPGHCRPLYTDYLADMKQVTNGIVVNDQLSPEVINANKRAFVEQFVTRPAFKSAYDSLSNEAFVQKLFDTTGVAPTSTERQQLINELNTGGPGARAGVVFKIVDGTNTLTGGLLEFQTPYGKAFYDKEFDTAFVFMQYIGYLRRNPDQAGFDFWLGKLRHYGSWESAEMVHSFVVSPEYRNRF